MLSANMDPRSNDRLLTIICLVLLFLAIGAAMSGCSDMRSFWKLHDTTYVERTVTKRDTVIWVKADSATIKLITHVREMRALIEGLKREGPRTVRGSSHASLTMSVVGDSLVLDARCDSLAQVLEDALVSIEEKSRQVTHLEKTVTEKDRSLKGVMPGWMKGTVWIIIIIVAALFALFLLYLLIKKHLFKRT